MNQLIKNKIEDIIKSAQSYSNSTSPIIQASRPADGLSEVIRTKEDAEKFMAELDALYEHAKKKMST